MDAMPMRDRLHARRELKSPTFSAIHSIRGRRCHIQDCKGNQDHSIRPPPVSKSAWIFANSSGFFITSRIRFLLARSALAMRLVLDTVGCGH